MKKITKEQLNTIMRDWVCYAKSRTPKINDPNDYPVGFEQSFVFGAISALLRTPPDKIKWTDLPPIVGICYSAGRPLSSLGNWDLTDTRLATASDTLGGGR